MFDWCSTPVSPSVRRGARARPRLAPVRRRRPPPPLSFRSKGLSGRVARRCPTAAVAAAAQGLPDARRRGQAPRRGAAPGNYIPDAHFDVILPTLLPCETFVLVDHDRRRRRRYRSQFTFAGELLDKALL